MTPQERVMQMRARNVPLPLDEIEGLRQAMKLRQRGFVYSQLAKTMGIYHGLYYSGDTWRKMLRAEGAPIAARNGQPRQFKA